MREIEIGPKKAVGFRKYQLIMVSGFLWLIATGIGLFIVFQYERGSGLAATPAKQFPAESRIERVDDRPTLIMLVHPHCPCSRASVGELALLMAQTEVVPTAYVLFLKPPGFNDDWTKTDLWRSASEIPGVIAAQDEDGREAGLFAAQTSGQTFLFDAAGQLLFQGGITGGRGHSGDNAGRSSIVSLLNNGSAIQTETDVYGCQLFNKDSECKHSE